MPFRLPHLYPITDKQISGLSHTVQVQRMVEGGATLIQLRDKLSTAREFYSDARGALDFARQHGVKLIINDRVDIAHALRADGVHVGQDDLPVSAVRELLGPSAIVGTSTHNLQQLAAAVKEPVDYIAFGPVFSTSSKQNSDPLVGLEGLRLARKQMAVTPLVAIGGINTTNSVDVWRAGADSVALISAILTDPDQIKGRVRALLDQAHQAFKEI
jgi:thiamine-phosphate pyrophosphorylase